MSDEKISFADIANHLRNLARPDLPPLVTPLTELGRRQGSPPRPDNLSIGTAPSDETNSASISSKSALDRAGKP